VPFASILYSSEIPELSHDRYYFCVWYSHKSLKPKRTLSASPHIIPFNVVFHEDSSLVAITTTITITNKSTRTHRPPSPPKLPLHSAAAALAYNNDQ
jgi:hypothetical protein